MLRPGIYDQLIDRRLVRELDQLPENQKATAAIDQAKASSVLSQYMADIVCKVLERMHDGNLNCRIRWRWSISYVEQYY